MVLLQSGGVAGTMNLIPLVSYWYGRAEQSRDWEAVERKNSVATKIEE
jgi:hypothetical protein